MFRIFKSECYYEICLLLNKMETIKTGHDSWTNCVYIQSQRNKGAARPGGFRKMGRAEIFQHTRDKNQFHWSSFSNLKDYFFVFSQPHIGCNKYLYPSQKQMMPLVIDSVLPGTLHKNENSVEGFRVWEKAWINSSLLLLINVCCGILWGMEMCHNKCSFGQDHYSCKLLLIFCGHHHLFDTTNKQWETRGRWPDYPHSDGDAKDFLIIKANLGSDTVIYN